MSCKQTAHALSSKTHSCLSPFLSVFQLPPFTLVTFYLSLTSFKPDFDATPPHCLLYMYLCTYYKLWTMQWFFWSFCFAQLSDIRKHVSHFQLFLHEMHSAVTSTSNRICRVNTRLGKWWELFQTKAINPLPQTDTHTHTNPLKTPRHVRGMFSLWGIHTSRSSEQRGFSWVRCVCACLCEAAGSCVGLGENLRPWGSVVVVGAKVLSQDRGRRVFCSLPRIQLLWLTPHWQMLSHCVCVCAGVCVFLVTNSILNTLGCV